ncbi:MAG: HAD family hydrolase [Bacilli bacterium]
MKKLIFDLDNTLLKWKPDYTKALEKTIEEFNLNIDYKVIDAIIEQQEKIHDIMNKETLLNDINNSLNINLEMNFINRLFYNQGFLVEIDNDVIDTLTYLSKKYELVVLTNYFTEPQTERLKNALLIDFFTTIIGGDQVKIKPNIEAFKMALGKTNPSDATMIGDSLICDIEGALNAKLEVIQIDYYNKYKNNNSYKIIRNFKELKNLL